SPFYRGFRLLVLLRASAFIQQNSGDALQDSSGREAAGTRHYQREACRRSTTGLRGGGYRTAQSRFGCWYPSREGGKETWHEAWQLADGGGSAFLVAASQYAHRQRQERPGHPSSALRMRTPSKRTRRFELRPSSAPGRPLGHC